MEKEEKQFDGALEALATRGEDLKRSINNFIFKLETESEFMTWPNVLDNFALLSGQVNNFMKMLKTEKATHLRNRVFLPLLLTPERDEDLAKLTENRVPAFNHEVVPDYLRTKPDPEVESKEQQGLQKASLMPPDAVSKQIQALNKIVNNISDIVKTSRDEWETETGQRSNPAQMSSSADTNTILAAIFLGKNLRLNSGSPKGPAPQTIPQPQIGPPRGMMPGMVPGKMPSSIKTNIKSAVNANHPYTR